MQPDDRAQFLNLAGLLEGGLVVLAFLLGLIPDINPVEHLQFTWAAVARGVLATLPMLGLFVVMQRLPLSSVQRIHRLLNETLAPSLATCRWYDLILLAAFAGIAEEILFRGLLQAWIEQGFASHSAGLIGSNIVFGLAHAVTPTYALLAGGMGLYLGWLFDAGDERNLLAPIITHGLYDYLVFLIIVKSYRQQVSDTAELAD